MLDMLLVIVPGFQLDPSSYSTELFAPSKEAVLNMPFGRGVITPALSRKLIYLRGCYGDEGRRERRDIIPDIVRPCPVRTGARGIKLACQCGVNASWLQPVYCEVVIHAAHPDGLFVRVTAPTAFAGVCHSAHHSCEHIKHAPNSKRSSKQQSETLRYGCCFWTLLKADFDRRRVLRIDALLRWLKSCVHLVELRSAVSICLFVGAYSANVSYLGEIMNTAKLISSYNAAMTPLT